MYTDKNVKHTEDSLTNSSPVQFGFQRNKNENWTDKTADFLMRENRAIQDARQSSKSRVVLDNEEKIIFCEGLKKKANYAELRT